MSDFWQSIMEFNSTFPPHIKVFDTAIFDWVSRKLQSEYKSTWEFAYDIWNAISPVYAKIPTLSGVVDVASANT